MSAIPPFNSPMGRLRMIEIYLSYDGPRLFACVNEAGQKFFGLFVDEDDEAEFYLYAPASEARFSAIRAGGLPLRRAFEDPTDGGAFLVRSPLTGEEDSIDWLTADDIAEDWLPEAEVSLAIPTDTQKRLDSEELRLEAEAVGRTLAAFELDTPWATTEFSLRSVGEVMRLVQESVDSFAQIVKQKPTERGAVQRDILEEAELSLYGLRAASFAFITASAPRGRLFEDPLVPQSLSILLDVMAASESEERLQESLSVLRPRALSKYRDLLEQLEDNETGLLALVAPPTQMVRQSRLTRDGVRNSLRLVRKSMEGEIETIDVEALLFGVNVRTKTFELFDDTNDRRYSGRAIDSARDQILGLTIGERYRARLLREAEVQPVTGEVHYKYRLTEIDRPDGAAPTQLDENL